MALCIGVDVGGTFTDCVLSDGVTTWRAKSPTTPHDLGAGVLAAAARAAEQRGHRLDDTLPDVERFGLGTTAVTNVLASGTGRRVGLLTTAGFEEMLAFARGARVPDADGWLVRPAQIVPPRAVVGIRERIDRDGTVITPLDPDEVAAAARHLVDGEGVEAVAVSFLWSFLEPADEAAAADIVRRLCGEVTVVSGAALHPAAREYERTTFAVLNAYVSGALAGIDDLEDRLRSRGLGVPLLLVHSGGGSITPAEAARRPLALALSGPAAGVAAAVAVAAASAGGDVVTCDMGGTSFDVSVVTRGEPVRRTRGELMGVWTALSHVDIESIGAGGGSLGWVDARGMLRVGPQSAGSVPGPARYGRGGTGATVTDALVVLGYLDPGRFLGGDFPLDPDAARAACGALGETLGLDAEETAWGIRELALAGMVRATRARIGALGLDPRAHALLAFGGSGALFTPDIAAAVGAPTVLVPELASVLSAFGAAASDIRRERLRAVDLRLPGDPTAVAAVVRELRSAMHADLDDDGVAPDARNIAFEADVRFAKQSFELRIPLAVDAPANDVDGAALVALADDFRTEYTRRYGHGAITLEVPIELVAIRAIGTGRTVRARLTRPGSRADADAATVGARPVRVARGADGTRAVPVHDGDALRPGHRLVGPALVDGRDTTVWVPPGADACVDELGTLVIGVGPVSGEAVPGRAREGRRSEPSSRTTAADPIALEILRSRLESVAEQASLAIEHTAVSPAVTESKDYSVTLMDADGRLVVGAGTVLYHFAAASHSVRATIARHGDTICDGDVFIANDPHNGGGLHPQDVMIQRPIHSGGRRIGWVGVSAHMMDMGGMVVGSFAPAATECFQEALRVPAVRLFREGVEVSEVWDIFRTNLRMAELVEMDLRGLVAGAHFATERLAELVDAVGADGFAASLGAIRDLTEAEMRRRIAEIADGTYRWTSWTEFDEEMFAVPCTLTVAGDRLVFDFEGAATQTAHFFNSKPYIVASELGVMLWLLMASDLPYNDGILAAFEVRCPEGSIVDARPPAPIAAAHMHVALNAATVALTALGLALAASPDAPARASVHSTGGDSALGNQVWAWTRPDGSTDAFIPFDGNWVGAPPSADRDGLDLGIFARGVRSHGSFIDVEVLEAWFPLLVLERRTRRGAGGAGRHRAGAGNHFAFRPHGIDAMVGTLFGMRRWLPLQGLAGGRPGSTAEMVVHRGDGSSESFPVHTSGVRITAGDRYEIRLPCAGGFGDPLDRAPGLVARDVADGRFGPDAAAAEYGVVCDASGVVDGAATDAARAARRTARLAAAAPAATAVAEVPDVRVEPPRPLYPGVVQRGAVAFAEASGAALAIAPAHWTDGCPVLTERLRDDAGPTVTVRTYLDPVTGRALHVEAVAGDAPRSFLVAPDRWTEA